jgi:hypothetical protein
LYTYTSINQSVGLAFAYISADFLHLFKGHSPFKLHKTRFSRYKADSGVKHTAIEIFAPVAT